MSLLVRSLHHLFDLPSLRILKTLREFKLLSTHLLYFWIHLTPTNLFRLTWIVQNWVVVHTLHLQSAVSFFPQSLLVSWVSLIKLILLNVWRITGYLSRRYLRNNIYNAGEKSIFQVSFLLRKTTFEKASFFPAFSCEITEFCLQTIFPTLHTTSVYSVSKR